jgi:hypothetical protein
LARWPLSRTPGFLARRALRLSPTASMSSARFAFDSALVRTQGKSGASPALSRNGKWRALPQARSPARITAHNLPTQQAKAIDLSAGRSFATAHRRQERRPPTRIDVGSSNTVSDVPVDAFVRWAALRAWPTDTLGAGHGSVASR